MGLVTDTVRNLLDWLDGPEQEKREAKDARYREIPTQSRRGILRLGGEHGAEVLFDGTGGAGFGITNEATWSTDSRIAFTRALVEADDGPGATVRIAGSYLNTNGANPRTKYLTVDLDAETFRNAAAQDGVDSQGVADREIAHTFTHYIQRPGATAITGWDEAALHMARWRDANGNDGVWFAIGANPSVPVAGVKLKVMLIS